MAWLLSQRGQPLCTEIAARESHSAFILYLYGNEDCLSLYSAMCGYVLACQGLLAEVRIILVRHRGSNLCLDKESEEEISNCFFKNRMLLGVAAVVDTVPDDVKFVELPAIYMEEESRIISGLCASLRYLLLLRGCAKILGFRAACLSSCAQVSLWTSFCEREMPVAACKVLSTLPAGLANFDDVCSTLLLLEAHLRQPVKTHNDKRLRRVLEVDKLSHDFVEGTAMTLSDLLLLCCVHVMLNGLCYFDLRDTIPCVLTWYRRMLICRLGEVDLDAFFQLGSFYESLRKSSELGINKNLNQKISVGVIPLPNKNLYSQSKENAGLRFSVKHHNASSLLDAISTCGSELKDNTDYHKIIDWDSLPLEVRPDAGDLPEKRICRKRQQISNVVNAVSSLIDAHDSATVVDFCSGGGHVAIVLAYMFRGCRVVLVENKYESLHRARIRCKTLALDNVLFIQGNVDRFRGPFEIAVSLHACGGATDLVIEMCLRAGASFVAVPCCYGAITRVNPLDERLAAALSRISHTQPPRQPTYSLISSPPRIPHHLCVDKEASPADNLWNVFADCKKGCIQACVSDFLQQRLTRDESPVFKLSLSLDPRTGASSSLCQTQDFTFSYPYSSRSMLSTNTDLHEVGVECPSLGVPIQVLDESDTSADLGSTTSAVQRKYAIDVASGGFKKAMGSIKADHLCVAVSTSHTAKVVVSDIDAPSLFHREDQNHRHEEGKEDRCRTSSHTKLAAVGYFTGKNEACVFRKKATFFSCSNSAALSNNVIAGDPDKNEFLVTNVDNNKSASHNVATSTQKNSLVETHLSVGSSLLQKAFQELCHMADRNESGEGSVCMDAVDSDRVRFITAHGYQAFLTKILPLDSTPKHNMIIARNVQVLTS